MRHLCLGFLFLLSAACHGQTNDAIAHGKALTSSCVACHGADGNGQISVFPKLAGQPHRYLLKQLDDIQSGKRPVPQMATLLDKYSAQDLSDIAAYFANQRTCIGQASADTLEQGEALYRFGNPDTAVPACASCHGPAGKGLNSAAFPALSGQFKAYTKTQLNDFKSGKRNNDTANMMQTIARKLSAEEIDAVSDYLQGLH